MKFEPVINRAVVSTLAAAILTTLVAFNVPITSDQRTALLGLVAAVCAIFFGGAIVARSEVYPVDKVEQKIIPMAKQEGKLEGIQETWALATPMMGPAAPPPMPPPAPTVVIEDSTRGEV